MMNYWGFHFIADCGGCNRQQMSNKQNVDNWIRKLVLDIDMNPIGEPKIEYTASQFPEKAGFTVVQLIVTSSIVAHFVDDLNQIYLDVFSCRDFNPNLVEKSMIDFFTAKSLRKYFLTRQAD